MHLYVLFKPRSHVPLFKHGDDWQGSNEISHLFPVNPETHIQTKPDDVTLQIPPFSQIFTLQTAR